jgi:mono/diheme cytochrome c family protein
MENVMINSARRCKSFTVSSLLLGVMVGLLCCNANASDRQVARGKYLTTVISCTDCHTPGTFLGKPDFSRYLGGSDVGFEVPGLGVFYAPNLTANKDTGLGNWTNEQIATAITTGKRPDGRVLAPPMPVESFKNLTHSDALAIAAYLKTLPLVNNKVPGPFGPMQKPTSFVYQVLPPNKYVPTGSAPAPVVTPSLAPVPVPGPASASAPVPTPATTAAPVPTPATVPGPVPVPAPRPGK